MRFYKGFVGFYRVFIGINGVLYFIRCSKWLEACPAVVPIGCATKGRPVERGDRRKCSLQILKNMRMCV